MSMLQRIEKIINNKCQKNIQKKYYKSSFTQILTTNNKRTKRQESNLVYCIKKIIFNKTGLHLKYKIIKYAIKVFDTYEESTLKNEKEKKLDIIINTPKSNLILSDNVKTLELKEIIDNSEQESITQISLIPNSPIDIQKPLTYEQNLNDIWSCLMMSAEPMNIQMRNRCVNWTIRTLLSLYVVNNSIFDKYFDYTLNAFRYHVHQIMILLDKIIENYTLDEIKLLTKNDIIIWCTTILLYIIKLSNDFSFYDSDIINMSETITIDGMDLRNHSGRLRHENIIMKKDISTCSNYSRIRYLSQQYNKNLKIINQLSNGQFKMYKDVVIERTFQLIQSDFFTYTEMSIYEVSDDMFDNLYGKNFDYYFKEYYIYWSQKRLQYEQNLKSYYKTRYNKSKNHNLQARIYPSF